MPAYSRRDIVDEDSGGVYHCVARCVRRAFLCGTDSYTGRDFSHRKAWVLDRLRELARLFGVEVCDYAVMSNHFLAHRTSHRPDVARQWSSMMRLRSGMRGRLFPPARRRAGRASHVYEPDRRDVAMLTADADHLAILRSRLASLSWSHAVLVAGMGRPQGQSRGGLLRKILGRPVQITALAR